MSSASNLPGSLFEDYFSRLSATLNGIQKTELLSFFSFLLGVRHERANLFIVGNGGSSTTAQHFAVDLGIGGLNRNSVIRAISLSDNQGAVTAISNDSNFDQVFSSQLSVFADSKDCLLVISASGNSENLVTAVALATSKGMKTFGLLGFDGGKLRKLCNESILVETSIGEYGIVEDIHLSICHNMTEALRSTP